MSIFLYMRQYFIAKQILIQQRKKQRFCLFSLAQMHFFNVIAPNSNTHLILKLILPQYIQSVLSTQFSEFMKLKISFALPLALVIFICNFIFLLIIIFLIYIYIKSYMKRQITDDDVDLPLLKIVVVGESGVGKSNIISRYAYDKFYIGMNTTIGLEFVSKAVRIENEEICLQIWDTAGQERFRALNRSFYRHAMGAVIVFSVGDRSSFINLKRWIEELRENTVQNLIMILVGNKCDLKERQVSVSQANEFAQQEKMAYIETSAALNVNVDKVFEMLSGKIYQIYKKKSLKKLSTRGSVLSKIDGGTQGRRKKPGKCCE